jgi:hypothetical protein
MSRYDKGGINYGNEWEMNEEEADKNVFALLSRLFTFTRKHKRIFQW